eukprot:scaffold12580_cov55-Attheya_sp.AAC.8
MMDGVEAVLESSLAQEENTPPSTYASSQAHVGDETPQMSGCQQTSGEDDEYVMSQSEEDETQPQWPIFSILNLVVDHIMVPPSPLEPEEFQTVLSSHQDGITNTYGEKAVEVPVLRIFGPLLRRREPPTSPVDGRMDPNHYNMAKVTSKDESPQQSGCLHIHGAFPYLLARPIIAGPDGSTSQEQIFSKPNHGWMDWDDESRVRGILDEIQLALERTLDDFQHVSRKEQEGSGRTRWIRDITISVGRGFYTYCPGPPAPFLRIEYYDPSLRWKVKRVLERGLSLGSHCHPPPDLDSDDACTTLEEDDETMMPLQFRCYEAHIPYTMQFFKDWNLAGMSYIHVSDGRIRGKLPTSARQTFQKPKVESNVDDDNNSQEDNSNTFLASNSPSHLLWSDSPGFNPENIDKDSSVFSGDQYWTRKETSCDVEFDTSVHQILNVHNVMTSLPDTPEERDQIHWRAVPSLHEIWEQERTRMSTLLPPQHDFLSHPSNDDIPKGASDNINKDGGASDFETTTPPFTLNVKKGASVSGAQLAVEGVRKLFDTSPGLEEDYRKAMVDIVKRHEKYVDEADERLLQLHQNLSINHEEVILDDRTSMPEKDATDEVIEGLNTFGDDFLVSTEYTDKDDDHGKVDSKPAHEKKKSVSRRLSLTQSQIHEEMEAMELGLQIDRGESIAIRTLTGGYIQDIDPDTLTPFDDDGSEDDFLQEEDRLGEAGLERTLSMLATQQATIYDKAETEAAIVVKEIDTEKIFSRDFESCDEDTVESTFIKENNERSALSQPADISIPNMAQAPGINSSSEHEADTNHCGVMSEDVSCSTPRWPDSKVSLDQSSESTSRMTLQYLLRQRTTLTVELFRKAPLRSECIDCDTCKSSVSLYPLERRDSSTPPPWLYFVQKSNGSLKIDARSLFEEKSPQQTITIEPTKSPPSRQKVESWYRKYARRFSAQTMRKRNRSGGLQKQAAIELEINENSRKLMGNSASIGKRKRVCFQEESISSSKVLEVEEAELDGENDFGGPNTTPTQSQNSNLLSLTPSQTDYNQSSSLDRTPTKCASDESIVAGNQRSSEDDRPFVSLITPKVGNPINCSSQGGNESTMSTPLIAQSCTPGYTFGHSDESATSNKDPLLGIGQQGGRIHVQGGGGLKATTSNSCQQNTRESKPQLAGGMNTGSHAKSLPSPMTLMSIEVHVQCRTGKTSSTSSKEMAMRADSSRDAVFAVVYVLGLDPGGGEAVKIVQRGCLYVPVARENRSSSSGEQDEIETADRYSGKSSESTNTKSRVIGNTLGISSNVLVEEMQSEKQLLMRLACIVRMKDPDALLSWDTQGGGLGYLIERGAALSKNIDESGDMSIGSSWDLTRLLGRTPEKKSFAMPTAAVLQEPARNEAFLGDVQGGNENGTINEDKTWIGSGLGTEWDDRVGAGSAAASIVSHVFKVMSMSFTVFLIMSLSPCSSFCPYHLFV